MALRIIYLLGFALFCNVIYQLSGRLVDIECEFNIEHHGFWLEVDSERAGFFSHALRSRALRLDMVSVVYEEALWEKWGEDIEFLQQFLVKRSGDRYYAELKYADGERQTLGYLSQRCRNNLKAWTDMHPLQSQNWQIE